ncbi:MAG: GNAT family N-acetyltransferase [Pirellulaceae bacterium]
MIVERLTWDSHFFGLSVGRLRVLPTAELAAISQAVRASDCDVVYVEVEFKAAADFQIDIDIENKNKIKNPTRDELGRFSRLAPLVDHKFIYEKPVPCEPLTLSDPLSAYAGGTTASLLEMALASGEHSRFAVDPRFRPHFRRLYQEWLQGLIRGDLADILLVRTIDGEQVGFVSAAHDKRDQGLGQIGLLAVAESHRRRGLASELLENIDAWCQASGLRTLRVVTQENNRSACALYERRGFQLQSTVGIYHVWNDNRGPRSHYE